MESKFYCLKNSRTGAILSRPDTGPMYSADRKEAEDMLWACHQYIDALGLGNIRKDFVIQEIDAATLQEL